MLRIHESHVDSLMAAIHRAAKNIRNSNGSEIDVSKCHDDMNEVVEHLAMWVLDSVVGQPIKVVMHEHKANSNDLAERDGLLVGKEDRY